MMNIDLNRGVTYRRHGSGMLVFMYKKEPGVYLSASGVEVSEDLARAAGFPVDELHVLRERSDKIAEAMSKIDAEFGAAEDEMVYENGGFEAVCGGPGRFYVRDAEGLTLTDRALSRDEAVMLVDQLAPKVEAVDLGVGAEVPVTGTVDGMEAKAEGDDKT